MNIWRKLSLLSFVSHEISFSVNLVTFSCYLFVCVSEFFNIFLVPLFSVASFFSKDICDGTS